MGWKYRSDEITVLKGSGAPTATVSEPTMYVDLTTGAKYLNVGGATWNADGLSNIETLTAARVLTAADSGKRFFLALAGGFDVTLPALTAAGCHFEFIVTVAPTTAYTITGATADKMAGSILSSSGAAEDTEADITGDVLNFVANTAKIGDRAVIDMNGAGYYVFAICSGAGGITITG